MNSLNRTLLHVVLSILLILTACGVCFADCPDDPDEDIQWVSDGSVSLKWGETRDITVHGITYILKANDFDSRLDPTSVSISVANKKTGNVEHATLFLENYEYRSFEYGYELYLYLEDIDVDSYKTPSAKIEYYGRGRPEFELDIEGSSEDVDDIDISSEEYAPAEEKEFEVTIENSGDARFFDVELRIDPGDFTITEKNDLKKEGSVLVADIDCLDKDEELTFNFSAKAPEWDGETSPYDLNYNITACVEGRDILDTGYVNSTNLTLKATEPELNVVQKTYARSLDYAEECGNYRAEIDLSPWYIEGGNPEDLWDYVVIRGGIYNTGLYTVRDVEDIHPELPEELVAVQVTGNGTPEYISPDSPYTFGYKLMPTAPGTYTIDRLEANLGFHGENFSWSSGGSIKIIVHGPDISLDKSIEKQDGSYLVKISVANDGDRAAWVNVSDTVPGECGYREGSLEESIGDSSLPLDEWEINVHHNGSCSMSVGGVFLPPSTSLDFSYVLDSGDVESLPYAEAEFRARNLYQGYARSSYYSDDRWISQHWDRLRGEWVFDTPADTGKVVEEPEPEPQGPEEGTEIPDVRVNSSVSGNTTEGPIEAEARGFMVFFDGIIDSVTGIILGTMASAGNAVGGISTAAGTIAEEFLPFVVMVVVAIGSLVGVFLLKK